MVRFSVHDKVFKTSRSLFLHQKDNVIVCLMFNEWQGDTSKPAFMDRYGDTFGLGWFYLTSATNHHLVKYGIEGHVPPQLGWHSTPGEGTVKI